MLSSVLEAAIISATSWLLWKYLRQIFVKSPLDNVPGPVSKSFALGHLGKLTDRQGWDLLDHLTDSYNGVAKLDGAFGHRMLYVFDPTALHHVILKDQYVYEEAAWFLKSSHLTFGPGLLSTLGDHHRKQRKLLNPVFSIAHMRRMIPIFNEVGHRLQIAMEACISHSSGPTEIDMISWMGRTALELVGQAGLGYSFDPLVGEAPDEFATAIKMFQPAVTEVNLFRRFLPYLPDSGKGLQRAIADAIPHQGLHKLNSIVDTLNRRSIEIYEAKKRALEEGDEAVTKQMGEGRDIMSILMRANMEASAEDKLPEEELIGQMSTFIFAAMDTTSNALAITLLLLAEHPEIQDKLRNEILESSDSSQDIDYDLLVSLPYLDAVCRETLRVHPPVAMVFRETRQDIVMPLSEPITGVNGTELHEIPVPKDTTVVVGIYSANRNKAIWGDDALEWKPERWLSPLPSSVTEAKIPGVYSNLMTFIGGGRACIGFKFSQLEMKLILCLLLSKFTFELTDKRVVWNLSGVMFPSVEGSTKASMPLRVGIYKRN
ncbi:cytochrome P450 [Earliella scabrosa]|nr:cytochrome P450 [Earliella scabrosa]